MNLMFHAVTWVFSFQSVEVYMFASKLSFTELTFSFSHLLALTIESIMMVLKELATFHATAYHFINTYPGGHKELAKDFYQQFQADFFDPASEVKYKFVEIIAQSFGTPLLVIQKFGSKDLADRMVAFEKNLVEKLRALLSTTSKLSYIVHGDAWYNNFLFR